MYLLNIIKALLVRLVLLVHSLLVIWLAASMKQNPFYWLLTLANLGMILEGALTVVKHKAQEFKWFCPSFFFYLCATIPGIWILELNRMQAYQDIANKYDNSTELRRQQVLGNVVELGIEIPNIEMETDTWVIIMEQLFLYLMILSRWILPRGEISRDELSQLLFVFIGIASDITELFALFEESKVRENSVITYVILCVWTVSLFQFTFVLTSTHNPKRNTAAPTLSRSSDVEAGPEESDEGCIRHMFQTEVWSIFVNFCLQDGPFLAVRLYIMLALKILTYSIIFFTAKNALLVMLLVYRMSVVCCERKAKVGTESEASSVAGKDNKASIDVVKDE